MEDKDRKQIRLIKIWHNPRKLSTYFLDSVDMIIYELCDSAPSVIIDMLDGNQISALVGLKPVYKLQKI